VPFSLEELGPFLKENSLLPRGVVFFHQGMFFTPWGTCLGLALNFLLPEEVTS
jgi:hypothetical protein